ncbi:MAG: hypothetical protein ACYDEJ_15220 [Desulfitobacteriaceae bacterium]
MKANRINPALLIVLLMIITTGCTAKTYSTNQINPVDQAKIHAVRSSMKPSYQAEFADAALIRNIIDNLNDVQVKKLSPAEEAKVLGNGSVMNKDSIIILELIDEQGGKTQSFAVLLSDNQLLLSDAKTMQSSERTVSYLNNNDEASLKAVQEIYRLLKETAVLSPSSLPASVRSVSVSDDSPAAVYWNPKDQKAVYTQVSAWLKTAVPYTEKLPQAEDVGAFHANIRLSVLHIVVSGDLLLNRRIQ